MVGNYVADCIFQIEILPSLVYIICWLFLLAAAISLITNCVHSELIALLQLSDVDYCELNIYLHINIP